MTISKLDTANATVLRTAAAEIVASISVFIVSRLTAIRFQYLRRFQQFHRIRRRSYYFRRCLYNIHTTETIIHSNILSCKYTIIQLSPALFQ